MADRAVPFPPLLRLPDEILLDIAMRLDDGAPTDLRHLARVHRRFRGIAQEVLVRIGRVSINSIPRYIELLEANRGWIAHIKHVDFRRVPPDYGSFDPFERAQRACARLMRTLPLSISAGQQQSELVVDLLLSEHWVLALLAILRNVTTITIGANKGLVDSRYAPLLTRQFFEKSTITGLRSELLDLIEGRLETVNITMDKASPRRPKIPFRLVHFTALKTCIVAGDFISGVHFEPPPRVLPQQLEILRITCDKETCPWDWIDWLQQHMMRRDVFQSLQCIQLFVNEPWRCFADEIDASPAPTTSRTARFHNWFSRYRKDRREVLENWEKIGVVFETHFAETTLEDDAFYPADYTEVNLLEELRILNEE